MTSIVSLCALTVYIGIVSLLGHELCELESSFDLDTIAICHAIARLRNFFAPAVRRIPQLLARYIHMVVQNAILPMSNCSH
jgi:hypothetical protein